LQQQYQKIQALGAEVIAIQRENKDGPSGLKRTARNSGARFVVAGDLGAKATGHYSRGGFHTYIVDRQGVIQAVLTGRKFDRPTGQQILARLKSVLPSNEESKDASTNAAGTGPGRG